MKKRKLTPMSMRLALLVGLIGVTLGIFQSALTSYFDFKARQEHIQTATRAMLNASAHAAARAVFELNQKAAAELLSGLSSFDYILTGRIQDELGNTLADFEKKVDESRWHNRIRRWMRIEDIVYTLPLKHPITHEVGFGRLTVKIDDNTLILPILKRALAGFLIGLCNAILLIVVIWLIVHFYVADPLSKLAVKVKGIGAGDWGTPIQTPRKDEIGELARSVNIMMAKLKDGFEQLSISEKRFRTLFNATGDAIFVHDAATGAILDVNQTMLDMYGYSLEDIGTITVDLLSANDQSHNGQTAKAWIQKVLRQGPQYFEWHARRKNGELFWVEVALKSTEIEGEGRILAVVRDISERKAATEKGARLEQHLHQIQKIEAIGNLAGGVAHDFNNMLSVVIGYTEMLLMEQGLSEPIRSMLTTILDSAQRSANLVSQLLAFARKQTIHPRTLNINDTIEGMLKMLRRLIGEDIDLVWMPTSAACNVHIDPTQIDQILANLVVNARDAISGVGRVTIETHKSFLDNDYCANHPELEPGHYVLLAVSDTGCGMDQETIEKIFEPFFTTKATGQGTGLGMSTVYGIVKQNRGAITIESQPDHGSTFIIYLPAVENSEEEEDQVKKDSGLKKGVGTILMVEDDAAILQFGQRMLTQLGYQVITAISPESAIDLATAHKGKIDLLLTDVIMPQMNGWQLAQHLEKILPGIKCIYMSGYTADVIAHRGILHEGVRFIQKPFSISDLAAKVSEVMAVTDLALEEGT